MAAIPDKARLAATEQDNVIDPVAWRALTRKERAAQIARLFVDGLNAATLKHSPTA